jgi:hypothetical protein
MGRKLTDKELKEFKFSKVPVELALEDLIRHLIKEKGVKKFSCSTKDNQFAVIWTEDGVKKYVSVTSKSELERKALRSLVRDYVREINKEICEKQS